MAERPIRVGIIGVGWGSVVLVPAFRAVPEYEVAAICSRRPERVAEAGAKLGIADTSTDWEAFVQRDDLDVIAVCTPTDLHAAQTIAALRAGKHVICEKPVALSGAQARQMLDVAEETGLAHAVNFEGRWLPDRYAVWDLVQQGYLGDPYLARVTTLGELWHPSRHLQSEWMYKVDQGGGYLMGLSSHDIDYLCALFGPPVAVSADVRTTVPTRTREDGTTIDVTADDTSTLLLRFESGLSATITSSMIALGVDSRRVELFGSDAALTLDGVLMGTPEQSTLEGYRLEAGDKSTLPLSTRRARSGVEIPSRRAGSAILALALMLEDWLPAFAGKPTPNVPSLYDGWVTQSVVDAARASSDGAGWVELDLAR